MTSQYKTYPKYKNSGIKWIGETPEGWEVHKLKYLLSTLESGSRETGGGNQLDEGVFSLGGEHINWDGTLNLDNPKLISEEYYHLMNQGKLKINDVLLVKDGATIGKTAILRKKEFEKMAVNEHVFLMRSNKRISSRLLYYLICGDSGFKQIKLTEVGSAQGGINQDFIAKVYFSIPEDKYDQIAIANFLDKKTEEIDELIEKDKKLIELLKEKRTALINYAVTKGLDPNVKMKDSGIDWIGKIPEGWGVKKLKFVSEVYISNVDKKTYPNEHDVLLCNYIDVYKNEFITSNLEFMKATANIVQVKKLSINKNDVIITKDSETIEEIAIPAIVTEDFQNVVCGYHLAIIRSCKKEILGKYLFRLFQSKKFSEQFSVKANGVTRYGISTYPIKNIPILLPPKEEQERIVNHLDKHTIRIDKTIQKNQKKIELLEEYKKSLIHHTVTGKVDVRGA